MSDTEARVACQLDEAAVPPVRCLGLGAYVNVAQQADTA